MKQKNDGIYGKPRWTVCVNANGNLEVWEWYKFNVEKTYVRGRWRESTKNSYMGYKVYHMSLELRASAFVHMSFESSDGQNVGRILRPPQDRAIPIESDMGCFCMEMFCEPEKCGRKVLGEL
jgi:hypothetical protein